MVKNTLRKLWKDKCTIIIQKKGLNPTTKRTEFVEEILIEDEPCKLSFEKLLTVTENSNVPSKGQRTILFLSNELTIPAGSKIIITRGDRVFTYKNSSESAVFMNHQEIFLELFEGWA